MSSVRQVDAISGIATKNDYEHSDEKKASSDDHVASSIYYEDDGIHDGLEFPTDEERRTLRRVSDKIPWSAYMVAFVEMTERFSFFGSSVVFTNFIQQPLPPGSRTGAAGLLGQPGALGMGQRASLGIGTFYSFWCLVMPLFGAYMADTHWGRYKTICVCVGIAMLGHVLMIISAIPKVLDGNGAIGVFVLSLIIMGIGTGGFKANISPLVAEQYRRTKIFISTTKSGERVIVDPSLTVARIYMYFYLVINLGALIGQIAMAYAEKFVGFWLAFLLPTVIFALCPIVLWAGRNRYITSPPTGSVLGSSLRLWRYAARGRWSWNPVKTFQRMTADDFWENVKPSKQIGESKPRWMTFDDTWVDEVRRGFKACTVFLWFPIYFVPYGQISGNMVSQAAVMTTNGVPNDVLGNLDPFALIIFIPICDLLIYPALRRAGINWSALKKITWGFLIGASAMVWACVLQVYVYRTSPCGHYAATCIDEDTGLFRVSPLNVWIQTGAYILLAISEICAAITGLEYAFTKAPKNMRSLVMSVFLFTNAIASALSEAFIPISADPYLVWLYGTMACIAAIGGLLFWLTFRNLDAEEDRLNNLNTGRLGTEKE